MTLPSSIGNIDDLARQLQKVHSANPTGDRPFTTISYAQCIDGSIATRDRRPMAISGQASMTLTHHLRSMFAGILVGINTVLADNPQLTVRLASGPNPQPIVLDTHLRTPVSSRLVQRNDRTAWLASAADHPTNRQAALTRAGVECLPCALNGTGQIRSEEHTV